MARKPSSKSEASKTGVSTPILSTQVQDIAIDGVHGAFIHAGTVRMNLYVNAFDPASGDVVRTVTHRVVMPLADLVSFADTLTQLKGEIVKVGQSQTSTAAKTGENSKR